MRRQQDAAAQMSVCTKFNGTLWEPGLEFCVAWSLLSMTAAPDRAPRLSIFEFSNALIVSRDY